MKILETNYVLLLEIRAAMSIMFTITLLGLCIYAFKTLSSSKDNSLKKDLIIIILGFLILSSFYIIPYFLPKFIKESPFTKVQYKVAADSVNQIDLNQFDIVEQESNNIYILEKK